MENLEEDKNLIISARQGDEESLDILLKKYKLLASKIARSYFLIGAEYDDILQEAMIGLYRAYVDYDINSQASFYTFASLCIKRKIVSEIKKANSKKNQALNSYVSLSNQGAVKVISQDENEEIDLVIPSNSLSPDEKLIESEKLNEIKASILKSLSKMELKVLILFLKGNSYTEIAQKLNTNTKSIDNALSRIRHKLDYLKN